MRYLDSHLHLADYSSPERLIQYARSSETLLVTAGVDRPSSVRGMELAESAAEEVLAFVGTHPSEAEKEESNAWLGEVAKTAWGVGEIGLDPKYSPTSAGSTQARVFESQLTVAERLKKPVQIHSRGAETACLEALASYRVGKVLLHWLADETAAKVGASRGYFVSFGPALLNSRKLARIAVDYPEELVLTESDGPVPFPNLGSASGPYLVPSVVFRLASLKGKEFSAMSETIARNGLIFLGGGRKG